MHIIDFYAENAKINSILFNIYDYIREKNFK